MVTVVQLVERQFVALVVAGSNPVGHPIEPLAQSVEHLTFNQVVAGSIPACLIPFLKVCGCGGIGRRARFRFWWATVQVQVLSSAV